MSDEIVVTTVVTAADRAEDLLGYWTQHGDDAGIVARFAVQDLLELARLVLDGEAS